MARPHRMLPILLLVAVPLWLASIRHAMGSMPAWWPAFHAVAALALAGLLLAMGASLRRLMRERLALRHLWRYRRPCPQAVYAGLADLVDRRYLYVLCDTTPIALCAGWWRPRIYLSTGIIALLPLPALRAAIAHEEAHRLRRDPLRRLLWSLVGNIFLPSSGLHALAARLHLHGELVADRYARQVTSTRALAQALFTILSQAADPSLLVGSAHLSDGQDLAARLEALARPSTFPLPSPFTTLPRLGALPGPHLLVLGAWGLLLGGGWAFPVLLRCLVE